MNLSYLQIAAEEEKLLREPAENIER